MGMEYRLLNNGKGVMLTREPEFVSADGLYISFQDAPDDATVIFESSATRCALYRKLVDKTCNLPRDFISGDISVRVTVLNGNVKAPLWNCESIRAKSERDALVVYPNDADIAERFIEMQVEMSEIKCAFAALDAKCTETSKKVDKLLDGYDVD